MANRLQIRRGTGAPGGVFYEGEPIFDKTGKVLYVGDSGAAGSGAGTAIASGVSYDTVLEMLTQAAQGSAGTIKFQENGSNGNHYIGLTAPASVSSNFTFVLPDGDGSANQVLKTDGSGNLGFSTVVSSFSIAADSGTTDLVNTGETITFAGTSNEIETTVSNNQIQFGLPNTVTVTTGLNINSSQKLNISETGITQRIGDLTIQTNGAGDATGDDIIISAHDDVEIQVAAGTTAIYATGGGSVKLNNNGSTKLETTGGGISVTGDVRADRILLDDNEPINIGQSTDLVIKHDGTDNHITSKLDNDLNIELEPDGGTPKLYLRPTTAHQGITLGGGSGNPVELYHTNAKKFETTSDGASVTGDLYVSGNLNVVGTAVTFSTETVKVEDRMMELGLVDGAEPTSSTTWELGVLFNYHNGGTAKKSGIVWLNNQFVGVAASVTETADTGTANPQVTIDTFAPIAASDLYLGGTAASNQIINSSGEAVNLIFDGGSY
tara:strand:- start:454 stop:1935 length:1482 start_codon:yes stop_codon:yes gene_type:complete